MAPAPDGHRTVLLAEDDASIAGMLAIALRSRGYIVDLCSDGQVAVERVEAGAPFDLALVDVRMPRLGGVQVVARIRATGNAVPVIAMSAYNDDVQEREVLEAGADRFLRKPFTLAELDALLAAVLDGDASSS